MTKCTCETMTYHVDGEAVDGIVRRDGNCPSHGYPDDQWRRGDPLSRHRRMIDRETGEALPRHEAYEIALQLTRETDKRAGRPATRMAVDAAIFQSRFREETPREVEARLLREAAA